MRGEEVYMYSEGVREEGGVMSRIARKEVREGSMLRVEREGIGERKYWKSIVVGIL